MKWQIQRNGSESPPLYELETKTSPTLSVLADGRSVLIGNRVVRLKLPVTHLKAHSVRIGWGSLGHVVQPHELVIQPIKPVTPRTTAGQNRKGPVPSPMTGKILAVFVNEGDTITEGTPLCVIEAMKMENRIIAESAGTVQNLRMGAGQSVSLGDVLLTLT